MKTVLQICYQGGQHKKVLEVSFSHFPVNVFIDTALQSMRSVNKIRDTGHKFLLLNEKQHNFKRQGLSTTDPCPRATVTPCKCTGNPPVRQFLPLVKCEEVKNCQLLSIFCVQPRLCSGNVHTHTSQHGST